MLRLRWVDGATRWWEVSSSQLKKGYSIFSSETRGKSVFAFYQHLSSELESVHNGEMVGNPQVNHTLHTVHESFL